jgi:hypothetical protein
MNPQMAQMGADAKRRDETDVIVELKALAL